MDNKDNKNSIQDSRLTALEKDMSWIKDGIKDIKDNHLAHIYEEIKQIRDGLNARPSWLMAGLVAILVALITYILGA